MNRLFLISGIAVFVAATFLITNTPTVTMAYTCSSSSSTHNVSSQSGISGSSGSCSSSSSSTTSGPNGSAQFTASGPPTALGSLNGCFAVGSCSASASGQTASGALALGHGSVITSISAGFTKSPGQVSGTVAVSGSSGGVQSASSSSAGGSQSSCSSSSGTAVSGSTSSASTSQPGHCP